MDGGDYPDQCDLHSYFVDYSKIHYKIRVQVQTRVYPEDFCTPPFGKKRETRFSCLLAMPKNRIIASCDFVCMFLRRDGVKVRRNSFCVCFLAYPFQKVASMKQ